MTAEERERERVCEINRKKEEGNKMGRDRKERDGKEREN